MYLISGTGHCGSTALLMLFEALGYETGNSTYPRCFREFLRDSRVVEQLEKGETPVWPEVIKHLGGFCYNLESYIEKWDWKVDHMFILIRDLDESVNKRILSNKTTYKSLQISNEIFHSMTEEEKRIRTKEVLIHQIGSLVFSLGKLDIPSTIINYPRFAQDREYCHDKLSEGLGDILNFDEAYDNIINLDKVHSYGK